MTKVYFVKGIDAAGNVRCGGHWLAIDAATARLEFSEDVTRTNQDPTVVAAGLSQDMSGLTWVATLSKTKPHNAMNFKR